MTQSQLSWDEVSGMIDSLGGEENLAGRLREWREERGWTLQELATRMSQTPVNHPMSQSSLWRMENPGGEHGRRRPINLGDALAYARVFKKSIAEVLLPEQALLEVGGWRAILGAAEALGRVREAWSEYGAMLGTAQFAVRESEALRDRAAAALDDETAKHVAHVRQHWDPYKVRMVEAGRGIPDDSEFEAFALAQEQTPLLAALQDVMADRMAAHDGWAIGRLETYPEQTGDRS